MTSGPVYAVITGGGTGGHVTPALAIADALVARGSRTGPIRFVGAEARARGACGARGRLRGRAAHARRHPAFAAPPRSLWRSVRAVAAFGHALVHCVGLLRRDRPAVVVGVGGYASAPCVLATGAPRADRRARAERGPRLVNRVAVRSVPAPAVCSSGGRGGARS